MSHHPSADPIAPRRTARASRDCPVCGVMPPDHVLICECGHPLARDWSPDEAREHSDRLLLFGGAGLLLLLLGVVLGIGVLMGSFPFTLPVLFIAVIGLVAGGSLLTRALSTWSHVND